MGRKAVFSTVEYIPRACGIREAFLAGLDDDPVIIHIKPMQAGEFKRRASQVTVKAAGGALRDDANKVNQKIVQDCVERVENYEIEDAHGTVHGIGNGEALWRYGELEITNEVLEAVTDLSQLDEGDRKKLNAGRGGQSPITPRSPE